MLKKTITFEDYEGNERTEDFYFNLSKAEVVDFLTTSGGYTIDKLIEKLIKTENARDIMQIFKDLIYISYGEKSLDGRRFLKSKEVKDNFIETEAYSVLYMELISDAKKAADFLNGIIPKDLASEVTKYMSDPNNLPPALKDYAPDLNADSKSNIMPIA